LIDFQSGEKTVLLMTALCGKEPKNKVKQNANGRIFQIQNNKIALDLCKVLKINFFNIFFRMKELI
jgi:hypothetical protein